MVILTRHRHSSAGLIISKVFAGHLSVDICSIIHYHIEYNNPLQEVSIVKKSLPLMLSKLKIFLMTVVCFSTTLNANDHAVSDIEAAYVLFGQSTALSVTPMARVIISGVDKNCPQLTAQSPKPSVIDMSLRINPDPVNFPVTVCEAIYPFDTAMQVANSTFALPAVKKDINHITIFGDTGCKSSHQDCQLNSTNWPFPSLVVDASKSSVKPDVILHMGDYNYSGTPGTINIDGIGDVQVYDAGDNTNQGLCRIPGGYYGQNSVGSASPDSWQHWQSDFFSAAAPLNSIAPWVFARGNHELCSRAGPGWFYFLDANSSLLGKYQQQLSCPAAENHNAQVLSPPFLLAFNSLNIAMVDSANACDYGLLHADEYINQFAIVQSLIDAAKNDNQTWLQMHRPMWGVDGLDAGGSCGNDSQQNCFVNQTMQNAIDTNPLDASIDLIVSGHMHRFQVVDFTSRKHPDQLVVGNSGVKLSSMHPKKTTSMKIDGDKATVMGSEQFGYMNITLDGDNWSGELVNPQLSSTPLFTCDSQKKVLCDQSKN